MSMYTINGSSPPQGTSLLFCNGVDNSAADAMKGAQIFSDAFHGWMVHGFYNPTTHDQVIEDKVSNNLGDLFAEAIRNQVEAARQAPHVSEVSIIIVAHSHGVCVTRDALEQLPNEIRTLIKVHAFAGAGFILRSLAGSVVHYFYQQDLIADMGHNILENDRRLYRLGHLFNQIQKTPNLNDAKEKASQVPHNDMDYDRFFDEYDIILIPNPYESKPQFLEFSHEERSISEFIANIAKGFANCAIGIIATTTDIFTSHAFMGYRPLLAVVASTTLARHGSPQVFQWAENKWAIYNLRN